MKHSLITLALIGAFATPALAMTDTEWAPPSNTGLGGVGFGDIGGLRDAGSGGVGFAELPRVEITCGVMCRDLGVTIWHPNGSAKIYVGGSGPAAMAPSTKDAVGNDLTPEEQEKLKQKCLADCATQDKVKQNNCTISNAQFAAKVATVPIWTAVVGGIIGGFVFKGPGLVGGAMGGGILATLDTGARVKDQLSMCMAVAARDNNDCITKSCKAWFLAPLVLLRRRRQEDEA